jgi:hypothetical protein
VLTHRAFSPQLRYTTMAAVKTEAPAPEQPKPRMAAGNPNLDQLQGMLNLVVRVSTIALANNR